MPTPEENLAALGHTLPQAPKPVAAYIPSRQVGNLLYISGQIPVRNGELLHKGAVPSQLTIESARECALQCTLNGLAVAKAALGELSRIKNVIRVGAFVCCDHGFTEQPKVANACSELLVQVFGDAGKHARAAVGSVALPLGAPVEIEFLFEIA